MRILKCTPLLLLPLLLPASVAAQEKEKWRRVYSLDGAVIEMNTVRLTFGLNSIARVRLRTVLSKPAAVRAMPGVKYKSRVETIELKCAARQYRISESALLDPKGKLIESLQADESEEWKPVTPGGVMEKLFIPACKMISEKRL